MSQSQESVSTTYETLLVERRDRVCIVTINRPEKRNALNIQTREEGARVLEELRDDESVGVVVKVSDIQFANSRAEKHR